MLYRAGWATNEGQERILAIRLPRAFFDELLSAAVPSSFDETRFASHETWQRAVQDSQVRLQWDPDHDPAGRPLDRRAVQLGLRGEMLRRYGERELLSIDDITPFVADQRMRVEGALHALHMPTERIYEPMQSVADRIGLDTFHARSQCGSLS
jgi:hypothetical protein